ncbi:hypothetical protein BaRGS_00010625 [Batillaria attramentaria]|uniref:EB domain-containing protein n=1 Tax=Batillaria attramentaria TaxID=370345 RepID=A0ABD0LFE0_9CAEN
MHTSIVWTVTAVFLVLLLVERTDCLQCYSCPRTVGTDLQSANIDCLANGTERECEPYQDRCYSYVTGDDTVQKGCTRAENCIGTRICCQTDFCNAGYGAELKTGHGQPCEGDASCVQEDGMRCRRETSDDVSQLSRCLCSEGWFTLGAACLPQSGVGEVCFEDAHCRLLNSYCQYQRCRCGPAFFPNNTDDSCQLKLPVMAECSDDDQCRADNSVCLDRCVCGLGYLYDEVSGHCSGSNRVVWTAAVGRTLFVIHLLGFWCRMPR